MTYSTTGNNKSISTTSATVQGFVATIFERINAFRAERKELRNLSHHTEKAANLAQAERDVNRVWLG